MRMPDVALFGILAAALCTPGHSWSQEFRMQEVPSLPPQVYVAEARFALAKPAASIDMSKMITLAMVEQLDPSIRHRLISAADVIPNKDLGSSTRNPKRQWCEGGATSICIQSRYQLEGRLPTGIMLVNKIRENHKKIADFMEF